MISKHWSASRPPPQFIFSTYSRPLYPARTSGQIKTCHILFNTISPSCLTSSISVPCFFSLPLLCTMSPFHLTSSDSIVLQHLVQSLLCLCSSCSHFSDHQADCFLSQQLCTFFLVYVYICDLSLLIQSVCTL